jgi:antitoxin ParD1/3/4
MAYSVLMTIQLKPEIEKLIQQDLATGAYASIEDFVEEAVLQLHEQGLDLLARKEEINAKIEEGLASIKDGKLIDAEDAWAELEKRKQAWRSSRSA